MKKRKRKEPGLTTLMLAGAGFALALILFLSFVMAIISSLTKDPTALTGALSLGTILLSGAIAGFVTSRVNRAGGTLVGTLSAIITAAVILIVGLISGGGRVSAGMLINVPAYISISVLSSVLGKKRTKRRKKRYV